MKVNCWHIRVACCLKTRQQAPIFSIIIYCSECRSLREPSTSLCIRFYHSYEDIRNFDLGVALLERCLHTDRSGSTGREVAQPRHEEPHQICVKKCCRMLLTESNYPKAERQLHICNSFELSKTRASMWRAPFSEGNKGTTS